MWTEEVLMYRGLREKLGWVISGISTNAGGRGVAGTQGKSEVRSEKEPGRSQPFLMKWQATVAL